MARLAATADLAVLSSAGLASTGLAPAAGLWGRLRGRWLIVRIVDAEHADLVVHGLGLPFEQLSIR